MPLTDTAARKASSEDKDYKLYDEKGLYLLVHKNASKYWRLKYRFAGKEKVLALGVYPEVSLKQARIGRDKARAQLLNNIDPSQLKKALKAELKSSHGNSFRSVAEEWYERDKSRCADATLKKRKWLLKDKLLPSLGNFPISEITPPQVLQTLLKIEDSGHLETANRAKQLASKVFRFAVAQGIVKSDPTRDLTGVLMPPKVSHLAALTKPEDVKKLIRDINGYNGTEVITAMLKISPILFQRPVEIRSMEWSEIDFSAAQWDIPAHKMKMGIEHTVPLPKQALRILENLKPITSKRSCYVFPAQGNSKVPSSDAAVTNALRSLHYSGKEMTAHGFRAMARTMLDEVLEYPPHLIEHQLSHAVRDPLGRAYNRTSHLAQRKEMMQVWADYLDGLNKVR